MSAENRPADLAAVHADDALLDLLGDPRRTPSDSEVARALAAWRREIHAEPVAELVDTDTALAAICASRPRARRRRSALDVLAAVFAVLVIACATLGLAAKSAEPGDWLYTLARVLYGEGIR